MPLLSRASMALALPALGLVAGGIAGYEYHPRRKDGPDTRERVGLGAFYGATAGLALALTHRAIPGISRTVARTSLKAGRAGIGSYTRYLKETPELFRLGMARNGSASGIASALAKSYLRPGIIMPLGALTGALVDRDDRLQGALIGGLAAGAVSAATPLAVRMANHPMERRALAALGLGTGATYMLSRPQVPGTADRGRISDYGDLSISPENDPALDGRDNRLQDAMRRMDASGDIVLGLNAMRRG